MSRPTNRPTRLQFDALEAREVPATVALANGTLTITGTNDADTITVRQSATAITVDGISGSFARSAVTSIRINARDGNDRIKLDEAGAAVTKPAVIRAGDGNDVVNGGRGNDYIDGEAGNDRVFGGAGNDRIAGDTGADDLAGGDGNDLIAGGAGDDCLSGGAGIDRMWGGEGFDVIAGGAGHDHVYDDFAFWAVSVDDTDYVHHHILGVADNSGFGWFDAHLVDGDMRPEARMAARSGSIGRAQMIEFLKAAADGTSVTANEFHDLSAVVNTSDVTIDYQSRYLGKKVVLSDPANQWYTGGDTTREALGDLHAGASDDHLRLLVDKWFLGKDRPMAQNNSRTVTFDYVRAPGPLFVNGPSATDIRQGNVGDCYWMASLGAVARQDPQRIRDMFTDNGDGTFTVRLFRSGRAEYVTVDRYLPVNQFGQLVFANNGPFAADAGTELWVALAEKAYAQFNESGWTLQDGTNSYNGIGGALAAGADNPDGINGGWERNALRQITGASVVAGPTAEATFADVRAAFDAGKAVAFSTPGDPPNPDVVGNHVYMMVGYNATAGTITLRNPWGAGASKPEQLVLGFADVKASFDAWAVASI